MDVTLARCLENGDAFIVLDLPEKFTLGHDTLAVTSKSRRILGVRDTPPGPHFLWVSGPGAMSRCGYWYVASDQSGTLRFKQWDRLNETLADMTDGARERDTRYNMEAIYPRLIPCHHCVQAQDSAPKCLEPDARSSSANGADALSDDPTLWAQLTSGITKDFLARVTGNNKVSEWLVDTVDTSKEEVEIPRPGQHPETVAGTEFRFSFSPRHVEDTRSLVKTSFASGGSSHPQSAPRILELLDSVGDDTLVGELQFTFLTGSHLSNYSCLEHWWSLVLQIVLRAQLAADRPELSSRLLNTLHAQMVYSARYLEGDGGGTAADESRGGILEALPRKKKQLREALAAYKRRLDELLLGLGGDTMSEHGAVKHAFAELKDWFRSYGLDTSSGPKRRPTEDLAEGDDSDEDYAPVVVDLDENGREVGLLSWD